MKTSELQEFLRSISHSLSGVGVPQKSLEDLRAAVQALQPFGDMDLEQLTDFLKRAAEFRRSGEVSAINVRGLDELAKAARNLGEAVKTAGFTEVDAAAHILEERQALSSAMATVAEQFGLTSKFSEKKKWLEELRMKRTLSRTVDEFRRLQTQITSYESYQAEQVLAGIEKLTATDAKVIKAAAAQIGTSATGTGKNLVTSVLVKLTGIDAKPPKRAKKPKPEEPTAPPEQVEAIVAELQAMVEKAKDPDAVPDAEIDSILSRVSRDFSTAQQKDIARRVTGKGGRSSQGAIDNLRADLTAVKRALESQKV